MSKREKDMIKTFAETNYLQSIWIFFFSLTEAVWFLGFLFVFFFCKCLSLVSSKFEFKSKKSFFINFGQKRIFFQTLIFLKDKEIE